MRPNCTEAVSCRHDIQSRCSGGIDPRGFRSSETDRAATDDMADRGLPAETPPRDNAYRGSSRYPPHWHGFFMLAEFYDRKAALPGRIVLVSTVLSIATISFYLTIAGT